MGNKPKAPRSRRGLLPDEFRRRATVFVERLRGGSEEHKPSDGAGWEAPMYTTESYIVLTRRVGTDWTFIMEHNGVQTVIPTKVIERFVAHQNQIIKEQRSVRGREQAERRKNQENQITEGLVEDIDMTGIG